MSLSKSHTSKNSVVESAPVRAARNVVVNRASTDPADGLATTADLSLIRQAQVPPAVVKNPPRGLGDAFTPELIRVLNGGVVQGFFGTRVNVPEMVAAAGRYAILDHVRTRLENSANLTAQISAPDGESVANELGKLMRTWSDFEDAHPKEALALEPLHQMWSSAHPGRGPAKKGQEKQEKVEKDAVKTPNNVTTEQVPVKA